MRKALILILFALTSGLAYGQKAKLYLNKREIAPQSVHFLDPATIDSIVFYTGTEAREKLFLQTLATDSVFVIFKRSVSDVFTYYQLLNLYHLDDRARTLPLDIGMGKSSYLENAPLMMFNLNRVQSLWVSVKWKQPGSEIRISSWYNRPFRSDAGKMLTWLQGYVEGIGENSYYQSFKKK